MQNESGAASAVTDAERAQAANKAHLLELDQVRQQRNAALDLAAKQGAKAEAHLEAVGALQKVVASQAEVIAHLRAAQEDKKES